MSTALHASAIRLRNHRPGKAASSAETTPTHPRLAEETITPDHAAAVSMNAVSVDAAPQPSAGVAERVEFLVEYANSLGLRPQADLQAGVLTGVKILGRTSRNGRIYRPEAVAAAASLYEGVKVNVNHPKAGVHAPRDYQDRLGCLRNIRATEAGLFGDLHFNPHHAVAAQLAWDAQWAPENVGLSHNVQARTSRQEGQTIVEQILRVNSVDLVADPATTGGLFESREDAMDPVRADVKPAISDETATSSAAAALHEARQEFIERRRRIDETIEAARLPSEAVTAEFVEQLWCLDDASAQALIRERASFYRTLSASASRPKSKGPAPDVPPPGDVRHWARQVT